MWSQVLLALALAPSVLCLFLPLTVVTLVLNEVIRSFLSVLLWVRHRGRLYLVPNGEDATWDYREEGNTRNVLVPVITGRGQLDLEKCIQDLQERIFRPGNEEEGERARKLGLIMTRAYGYVCWKEDNQFDLRNHIRLLDDQTEYTETTFMDLLSQLSGDMDEEKPQWEWVIVPKYRGKLQQQGHTEVQRSK
jgi:hypothetical protein